MLFNAVALAALAAVAQAAPLTASDEPSYYGESTSSISSSRHMTHVTSSSAEATGSATATVTKTIETCSTTGSGVASVGTGSAGSGSSGKPKNLDPALAAAIAKNMSSEVTAIDRFNDLLSENGKPITDQTKIQERVVFDFNAAVTNNATGGRILTANDKNFPILTDLGISGAVAFLNPCSMNTPHTHPRATELLTLVKGDKLQTGMMLENNFRAGNGALTTEIKATLSPFQATVFPMGSIHFQFNPTCDDAIFVAALSSSDPGTSQIAQNFFFQEERIVNITLGAPKELNGKDIESFRGQIPANLVKAMDSCVAECKSKGINI